MGNLGQTISPLREDLKGVPRGLRHDSKNPLNVFERHLIMEQVTHRVHKNISGLLPLDRLHKHIRL
jgi:hypothetical protein